MIAGVETAPVGEIPNSFDRSSCAGLPIAIFVLLSSAACAKVEPVDQTSATRIMVDDPQPVSAIENDVVASQ